MDDTNKSIVEHYLKKKKEGLGFSEIRKELTEKNLDADTISEIIKEIDNKLLKHETGKAFKLRSTELKGVGLFVMIGGGLVTFATYFNLIDLKGYYIAAWGPLIGGYLMILASRRMDKLAAKK